MWKCLKIFFFQLFTFRLTTRKNTIGTGVQRFNDHISSRSVRENVRKIKGEHHKTVTGRDVSSENLLLQLSCASLILT